MGEGPHPIPVEVIKMKPPISLYILLTLLIVCAAAAFFSGSLEAAGLFADPSSTLKKTDMAPDEGDGIYLHWAFCRPDY